MHALTPSVKEISSNTETDFFPENSVLFSFPSFPNDL